MALQVAVILGQLANVDARVQNLPHAREKGLGVVVPPTFPLPERRSEDLGSMSLVSVTELRFQVVETLVPTKCRAVFRRTLLLHVTRRIS